MAAQKDARIYVAGHPGLIGCAVVRRLSANGYHQPTTFDHATLDLTNSSGTDAFFDKFKPEHAVLAAGRVGGIVENQHFPADFITTNLAIQLNVLRAARRTGVRRLIFPSYL